MSQYRATQVGKSISSDNLLHLKFDVFKDNVLLENEDDKINLCFKLSEIPLTEIEGIVKVRLNDELNKIKERYEVQYTTNDVEDVSDVTL